MNLPIGMINFESHDSHDNQNGGDVSTTTRVTPPIRTFQSKNVHSGDDNLQRFLYNRATTEQEKLMIEGKY